jgi:fimbrial chaperone protein
VRRTETPRRLVAVGVFVFGALCVSSVSGFQLRPITRDFAPSGRNATQTFEVINSNDRPIAVRLTVLRRGLTPDGSEIRDPIDGDFVVFPSRLALEPGRSQTVRVQWRGQERVERELAYRLIAEEVPVEFAGEEETGAGSIRIAFRWEAALYVVPPAARADTRAEDTRVIGQSVHFDVANVGTRHDVLNGLQITLEEEGTGDEVAASVTYSGEQLGGLDGINLLAGTYVRARLPLPEGWTRARVVLAYDQ